MGLYHSKAILMATSASTTTTVPVLPFTGQHVQDTIGDTASANILPTIHYVDIPEEKAVDPDKFTDEQVTELLKGIELAEKEATEKEKQKAIEILEKIVTAEAQKAEKAEKEVLEIESRINDAGAANNTTLEAILKKELDKKKSQANQDKERALWFKYQLEEKSGVYNYDIQKLRDRVEKEQNEARQRELIAALAMSEAKKATNNKDELLAHASLLEQEASQYRAYADYFSEQLRVQEEENVQYIQNVQQNTDDDDSEEEEEAETETDFLDTSDDATRQFSEFEEKFHKKREKLRKKEARYNWLQNENIFKVVILNLCNVLLDDLPGNLIIEDKTLPIISIDSTLAQYSVLQASTNTFDLSKKKSTISTAISELDRVKNTNIESAKAHEKNQSVEVYGIPFTEPESYLSSQPVGLDYNYFNNRVDDPRIFMIIIPSSSELIAYIIKTLLRDFPEGRKNAGNGGILKEEKIMIFFILLAATVDSATNKVRYADIKHLEMDLISDSHIAKGRETDTNSSTYSGKYATEFRDSVYFFRPETVHTQPSADNTPPDTSPKALWTEFKKNYLLPSGLPPFNNDPKIKREYKREYSKKWGKSPPQLDFYKGFMIAWNDYCDTHEMSDRKMGMPEPFFVF